MAEGAGMAGRVNRGEIWLYSFGSPDKRRPVLVLTRQASIDSLRTVTVAPFTTAIRGVASEVVVGAECGLKEPSAINLHNLVTVPRSGLKSFVGTVPISTLRDVARAAVFALGFDA